MAATSVVAVVVNIWVDQGKSENMTAISAVAVVVNIWVDLGKQKTWQL